MGFGRLIRLGAGLGIGMAFVAVLRVVLDPMINVMGNAPGDTAQITGMFNDIYQYLPFVVLVAVAMALIGGAIAEGQLGGGF